MGKRGNENAQQRREDYEAEEANRASAAPVGDFSRASAEVMENRRVVKRAQKFRAASLASPNNGSNPFASVKLAPPASSSTTSKPAFALPSNQATSFGTFSTTTTAPRHTVSPEISALTKGFQTYMKRLKNPRVSSDIPVKRFISTYMKLLRKDNPFDIVAPPSTSSTDSSEADAAPDSTNAANSNRNTAAPSATNGASLFPPEKTTPAPVAFSFEKPPTSSAPKFSFGGTSTPNASAAKFSFGAPSASSPSPAGISFGDAGTTSASATEFSFPIPVTTATSSNVAAANDDESGEETQEKEEPPKSLGNVDAESWDTILEFQAKAYHYVEGPAKKFGAGVMKVQKDKSDSTNHRMVMRSEVGKVLLNSQVAKGLSFQENSQTNAKTKKLIRMIMFKGFRGDSKEAETLMLMPKPDDFDAALKTLDELSK